jgi:hypothetical protein
MDQQAWLNTCDRVRKNHKLTDAYEHTSTSPFLPNSLPLFGETDCAFRINDVVGVQMSHQDNVWAPSFNPRDDLAEVCLPCLLGRTAVRGTAPEELPSIASTTCR